MSEISRLAVDDLFTHQAIADAGQGQVGDEAIDRVLGQAKSGYSFTRL